MQSRSEALRSFEKPIKVLFVSTYGVGLLSLSVRLIRHWNALSSDLRWSGIILGICFLLLGWSLLKGEDKSSILFYGTCAFLVTLLTVSRLF